MSFLRTVLEYPKRQGDRIDVRAAIFNPDYTDIAIIKIIKEFSDSVRVESWLERVTYNEIIDLALHERPALLGHLPNKLDIF